MVTVADCARDPADGLALELELCVVARAAPSDLEHAERPVHVPAVVQPRDRLLTRVAALREARRARSSRPASAGSTRSSISRPEARRPRTDAQELELVVVRSSARRRVVEHLDRRHAVVGSRNAARSRRGRRSTSCCSCSISHFAANRERTSVDRTRSPSSGSVRRRKSSAPRRQDDERRDHPRLRGEEQRLARVADPERLDVVREHALEVGRGVRAAHADERPRAGVRPVTP